MNKIDKLIELTEVYYQFISKEDQDAIMDYLQNAYSEDTNSSAMYYLGKEFNLSQEESKTIIDRYNMLTTREKINITTEDLRKHIF